VYGLTGDLRVVAHGRGGDEALLGAFEAAYAAGARAAVWEPAYPVRREVLRFGREWRRSAERSRVLTFVAERLDVALAIDADGVFLEHGFPVDLARKVLGRNVLLMACLSSAEDARQAARQGADALVLGASGPENAVAALGLVSRVVSIPCLGSGVADPEAARAVVEAGGHGVVVPMDGRSRGEVGTLVALLAKAVMEAV
jgi:thiamine monophosphate synthase